MVGEADHERQKTIHFEACGPELRWWINPQYLSVVSIVWLQYTMQKFCNAGGGCEACRGLADQKDAPILAAAVREECRWLITFNVRHYQPDHPSVTGTRPGAFVQHVRSLLAYLSPGEMP